MATINVRYGETTLEVPAGTTIENAKAALAQFYPEIADAEGFVEGNDIVFKVKAGTKGAQRFVQYGETRLEIPADSTVANAKAALSQFYPEVADAEGTLEGDTIVFKVKAGTKGAALFVQYGDTRLEIPAGSTVANAKTALSQFYPEVADAEGIIEGDTIVFKVKAGTKGIIR